MTYRVDAGSPATLAQDLAQEERAAAAAPQESLFLSPAEDQLVLRAVHAAVSSIKEAVSSIPAKASAPAALAPISRPPNPELMFTNPDLYNQEYAQYQAEMHLYRANMGTSISNSPAYAPRS